MADFATIKSGRIGDVRCSEPLASAGGNDPDSRAEEGDAEREANVLTP